MRAGGLLWALAGCAGLRPFAATPTDGDPAATDGDTDTDTDADTDADSDSDTDGDVNITSVTPAFGTNGGGEEVTIVGGPFDSGAEVRIDGVLVDDVTSQSQTELVVVTPSTNATGYVNVTVDAAAGSATATDAYQYWEDGTGKYGAYGEIGWYDIKGAYWDVPNPPSYGIAQVYFTIPSDDEYWKAWFTPTLNSCSLKFLPTTTPYQPDAPVLEMTSGNKTIRLPQSAANPWLYFSNTLTAAEVAVGGTYDLQPLAGAAPDWPSFTGTDFAIVPANAPRVTAPAIDGAAPPHVTESGFTFNWSSPYDGDFVAVVAGRARPDAMGVFTALEYATCIAADDGTFKIPAGTFSAWVPGTDAFYVYFGRMNVLGGDLPYDNSTSGVMGGNWEVGFAIAD